MTKFISRLLHSPLIMSIIGVVLAFSIMWRIADATTFRVDLPVYPGAQQVRSFRDSDNWILTFVTQDTEAQVSEFYTGSLNAKNGYYFGTGSEAQEVCCYKHAKAGTYLAGTESAAPILADYTVGIDFVIDQEHTFVKVTANNYNNGFTRINIAHSPIP